MAPDRSSHLDVLRCLSIEKERWVKSSWRSNRRIVSTGVVLSVFIWLSAEQEQFECIRKHFIKLIERNESNMKYLFDWQTIKSNWWWASDNHGLLRSLLWQSFWLCFWVAVLFQFDCCSFPWKSSIRRDNFLKWMSGKMISCFMKWGHRFLDVIGRGSLISVPESSDSELEEELLLEDESDESSSATLCQSVLRLISEIISTISERSFCSARNQCLANFGRLLTVFGLDRYTIKQERIKNTHQTWCKLDREQKFWVTAIVISRFITTCHQPLGTNITSPGCWTAWTTGYSQYQFEEVTCL